MNVDMKEDGKHGWEETRNEKAKGQSAGHWDVHLSLGEEGDKA